MKALLLLAAVLPISLLASAQNDKPVASPPAAATETLSNGTVVTIKYSQPSVKGREIGTKLEPLPGKVWRTGANNATVFEVSRDVKIEGSSLAAGKYGLFTLASPTAWTIIFNKTWDQWGAFDYKEADDILRVKVKPGKAEPFAEKMTFTISKDGTVTLVWGDNKVDFHVQ